MLGTILILLIACAVGAFVYWLTLRLGVRAEPDVPADVREWQGEQPESEPSTGIMLEADDPQPGPPGTGAYLPVTPSRPSWQSRVGGVMGLLIAVVLAAAAAAFAIYSVGHLIGRLLRSANAG